MILNWRIPKENSCRSLRSGIAKRPCAAGWSALADQSSVSNTSWTDARTRAHGLGCRTALSEVSLEDALGERLGSDVLARTSRPSFDAAAMDGYAVRGRGPWRVIGRVNAGSAWGREIANGRAVEIATGAPVPPGTTEVVPYERATRHGNDVRASSTTGANIRRAGEECGVGQLLILRGTVVTPAMLGLAASCGLDTLVVAGRPTVEALITGDELVVSGNPAPPRIRDAIGPMLPGYVFGMGARLTATHHLPDGSEELLRTVRTSSADVILVCGSTSRGNVDQLHGALTELGARLVIDGVICRPGHPQVLAQLPDGRPVVGLPGNPLAAVVALFTLLEPLVRGMSGVPMRMLLPAEADGIPASPATRLVPVRWRGDVVEAVAQSGSAMLRGLACAEALAVVEPGCSRTVGLLTLSSAEAR